MERELCHVSTINTLRVYMSYACVLRALIDCFELRTNVSTGNTSSIQRAVLLLLTQVL
jgi:hypothetical protein